MGQKSRKKRERRKQKELARKNAIKESKKRRLWPLYVGGTTLAVAGAVGTIVGLSGSELERRVNRNVVVANREYSYLEAARSENQAIRQRYIDQVIERFPPPTDVAVRYFHDRDYYPNPLFEDRDMSMRTRFTVPGNSEGIVEDIQTQIFRSAFRNCRNEDEFLNVLVDHEYDHLLVLSGRIPIEAEAEVHRELQERAFNVNGDLFEHYLELHAFYAQIQAFSNRENISDSFKENIISTYNAYRELVEEKEQTPLTRWLLEEFPRITEASANISFRQAVNDENLRQAYCNHIFQNRAKYGDRAWNSFLSMEYDPRFRRLEARRTELGFEREGRGMYGRGHDEVELACTPYLYDIGQKNHTWISENVFVYCQNEDEFLSVLDNEASSALLWETGKIHFPINTRETPEDMDNFIRAVELISFDLQFSRIIEGRRRVSQLFIERFAAPARDVFSYFVNLAEEDSRDGHYARAVVEAIRARPTIIYFEPNRNNNHKIK